MVNEIVSKSWHSLSAKEVIKILDTNPDQGLSENEVKARQEKFGLNKLPEERPLSSLRLFFEQFRSPLIYILVIAGIITLGLKEYTDTIIIFAAVVVNTIVGYFQENKASQALTKLKKILKIKGIVFRNGNKREILQEELVPGDIILLKSGNKVPADGRLIEAKDLKVNEAAVRTEIGKVAQMLREAKEEKTPYQKKLAHFSKIVGIIIALICFVIFIEGLLTGEKFVDMFTTAVAVAVAAIPEGLPISMTVILALGMRNILRRKGLVRKLASAETLGSTSIICTDKTATLTEGKMKVAGIYTGTKELLIEGKKYSEKINKDGKESYVLALKISTLCSEAFLENPNDPIEKWSVSGRPTDRALLLAGVQAGIFKEEIEKEQPKIDDLPFDPVYKYSAELHEFSKTENILYVLGAPELILQMSKHIYLDGKQEKISDQKLVELNKKYENLSSKGLRILATAYKKIEKEKPMKAEEKRGITEESLKEMVFVGFIALNDPLRPEVKESIRICRQAGMKPIIVTGDHRLTAKAIAEELGLPAREENIIEGKELEGLSDEEFEKRLENIEIYARVEPRQKLRIVEAWQKRGQVVAMTGDGINDAPALKKADIGVALGSGTDVAKEVSDLILLDDNFSVIVAAVEEGRAIIDNMRKVITYLLSDSFTEIILIGGSLLAGFPLPILPVQILWVNLIEDGLPHITLAFEPKEKGLMEQKPQSQDIPLLTREMKTIIFIIGLFTDLILLGLFFWLWGANHNISYVRTMIFACLSIDSLFYVFSCKSLRRNLWHINLFSNKYLIGAFAVGVVMLVLALYIPILQTLLKTVPLGVHDWLIIFCLGFVEIFLIEITKWYFIVRKQYD